MLVLDLRPGRRVLKLFVWLAIAFRHGAYERQDAALLAIARDLGALRQSPSLQGAEAGQGGWDRNGTVAAKTSS